VTPTQDGLWWADHRAKNRSVYNLTGRLALGRDLDRDALAAPWELVVHRHDTLRTSFRLRNGRIALTSGAALVPSRVDKAGLARPDAWVTGAETTVCNELAGPSLGGFLAGTWRDRIERSDGGISGQRATAAASGQLPLKTPAHARRSVHADIGEGLRFFGRTSCCRRWF
jgi:Condensation domain